MLIQLNIKNFALIENISLDLGSGFNILSGETGAGKSILIDAIDYVLGGKFSKDLIRTGEERTRVEAIFSIDSNDLRGVLNELEIESDDVLIISRETLISGKTIIKVNGKSFIVSQLRKIREKLLDIHGQHQSQNLLQKSSHVNYLDNYIGSEVEVEIKKFLDLRNKLLNIREKIKSISGNNDKEKLADYIKFQIEDIDKANLKIGEEEDLKDQYNILSNAEKITKSVSVSYNLLNGVESAGIIENISKVLTELGYVEEHLSKIKEKREIIEEAFYNIEETSRELRDILEEIYYDEEELSKINERLFLINSYKKKYGGSIEAVLDTYNNLKQQYEELINAEEIIKELKEEEKIIYNDMKVLGEKISNIRKKYSGELREKILTELSYVGLDKSNMNILIETKENFDEKGFDDVTFMISTNPGEPMKSLEKVLSGGELSRIMLALKCVFADKDDIPTLIFDEIDTGISGQVGQRVGEKMYQVSKNHQVLCITHLPQIAILSDHHYFVSKEIRNEKTFTNIRLLSNEEKIYQVATMLGGDSVTNATLENVREMFNNSIIKKSELKSI
ncbi:DNA repair protein RecN [Clostridium sp.]|uniref:DNA repair protein RecN n=1 Tax=Clostridium sp. TaxID=1506 RepID=UPI0026DC2ADE|nr:DNA repair protein RecN [Clostridium sp.]MDO5039900.1 DNA repair protein RecN [Clostridium sp.]